MDLGNRKSKRVLDCLLRIFQVLENVPYFISCKNIMRRASMLVDTYVCMTSPYRSGLSSYDFYDNQSSSTTYTSQPNGINSVES